MAEIRAQMRGAAEGGGIGWMLWNPRNDYTGDALRPKTEALAETTDHTNQAMARSHLVGRRSGGRQ